jgi:flagellar hook-associated protein 2
LKLDVLGGSTGDRGSVRYGVGIAGQLDQMITKLVSSKGLLASRTESLQSQVKAIEHDRTSLNERLEKTEARYRKQFSALDQQMSSMQSMSAYLAQQLAAISRI